MNDSEKLKVARCGRGATLSKGDRKGQATGGLPVATFARMLKALAVVGALWAVPALAADRPTPSGLPVPRWVTLKFGQVNARAGPGDDYKLLWVYTVRSLPVQVIAETREWRRICDPRGGAAWVHMRTIDGRRSVFGGVQPAEIHARPKAQSRIVAYLRPQSLAALDRCKDGWCKVKVERVSGWVAAPSVWGATDAPQCR